MIDVDFQHAVRDIPAPGKEIRRTNFSRRMQTAFVERTNPQMAGSTTVGIIDCHHNTAVVDGRERYDSLADLCDEYGFDVERRGGDQ